MDDIQTWIYIIIGVIYFVIRSFRKKTPEIPNESPVDTTNPQRSDSERRKPLTFEELLKEFTDPESRQTEEEVVEEVRRPEPEKTKEDFAKEGSTRRFSDEESRKVYEESIKQAEGFEIPYDTDEDYHIEKFKAIPHDHDEEEDTVADDIRSMLSQPEDAKRAIILGEIINRKY